MNKTALTVSLMFFAFFAWQQPASTQSATPVVNVKLTVDSGARQSYDGFGFEWQLPATWMYLPTPTRDAICKFLFDRSSMHCQAVRMSACWEYNGVSTGCSTPDDRTCADLYAPPYADFMKYAGKYNPQTVWFFDAKGMGPGEDLADFAMGFAEMARRMNRYFKDRGLPQVSAIGMENEPDVGPLMTAQQSAELLKWYRYGLVQEGQRDPELRLDTIHLMGMETSSCAPAFDYFGNIMADSQAFRYLSYFATHSYNQSITDGIEELVKPYILNPDSIAKWGQKQYWITEASDVGREDFHDATVATSVISRFMADMNHLCSVWIHYIGPSPATSDWCNALGTYDYCGNRAALLLFRQEEQDWRPLLKCYYIMQANRTFEYQCRFRKAHTSLYVPNDTYDDNCHCCSNPDFPYCRREDSTMVFEFGQKPPVFVAATVNPDGSWGIGLSDFTGNVDPRAWESVRGPTAFSCTLHVEELVGCGDIVFKGNLCDADTPFIHDMGKITMHNGDLMTTIRPMTFQTFRSQAGVTAIRARYALPAGDAAHTLTIVSRPGVLSPVTLRFSVDGEAMACPVRVAVYTMRGSFIRVLFAGRAAAGENRVDWNGAGQGGTSLANGSYLVKLEIGGTIRSKTIVLAR